MKLSRLLLFLLVIVLFVFSCKKQTASFWYTGMQLVDTNGKFTRWVGTPDNDWQINKYTFTAQQSALLTLNPISFPDWGNTMASTVAIYPGTNPVGLDTGLYTFYSFRATADSDCAISYTVTDEKMNIISQGNTFLTGGASIYVPVQMPTSDLAAGKVYRLYYGFSSQFQNYFAKGWGDFGVCTINKNSRRTNSCF